MEDVRPESPEAKLVRLHAHNNRLRRLLDFAPHLWDAKVRVWVGEQW
jgi:hypothetical protein